MITIETNNQSRDLLCFADLPLAAQADFDYLDPDDHYSPRLVLYKGHYYDTCEFQVFPDAAHYKPFGAWDGVQSDSYFSGVVLRYTDDYERVIMGTYYS